MSHREIWARCGTAGPPVAGNLIGAATNSYAVKYMGADKSQIESTQGEDYKMTQQSDAVVEAIHSGDAPNSRRAVCNKALREMIDEQR